MLWLSLGKATVPPDPSSHPDKSHSRSQLDGLSVPVRTGRRAVITAGSFMYQTLTEYLLWTRFSSGHWGDMIKTDLPSTSWHLGGRENVQDKLVNRQINNYFPIVIKLWNKWIECRDRENMGKELIWNELFKLSLSEQVRFQQSPQGREGASHARVESCLGRKFPAQETTQGKPVRQERTWDYVLSEIRNLQGAQDEGFVSYLYCNGSHGSLKHNMIYIF